ncbi:MAG TPA: hypothetical protein VGL23_00085, partial [Chloroflexota bacterium]
TDDHLALTKEGWKPIGALTPGEKIALSPFVGLAFEAPPESRAVPAPALLRLLGHVCAGGQLTRNGQRVSLDTTDPADGEAIAADLRSLGYRGTARLREPAPGRLAEVQVRCDSAELHRLLADLGAPVGAKRWPAEALPWLFELPGWARAQFLSGLASAGMSTPRMEGMRQPNLQIRLAGADDDGARLVARLLGSLGFGASVAPTRGRGARRDRVVQLVGGEREQVRFFAQVGFCYARRKREAAARVASVCWQRWAAIEARERAGTEARSLRAAGLDHRAIKAEISTRYGVTTSFVHHAIYGQRGAPRRPIGRLFAPDAQGEIAWAAVTGLEPLAGPAAVYDVATGDPAESFLANGVVVHNCGTSVGRDAGAAGWWSGS